MALLKRKIQNLYTIITRICYRVREDLLCSIHEQIVCSGDVIRFVLLVALQDLVFFTEDCAAIDTGHTAPYYAEDRLQLLQEER